MRKLLTIACAMFLGINMTIANPVQTEVGKVQNIQTKQQQTKMHRENMFEKRLGLTEVQKLKAGEIRRAGHEKLKPVIDEIISKKQEAEMIRRSRMAVQMQEEKLTIIDKELNTLERKANEIKKANMKEFESILTWQQKRILKQMKKEGRKKYHQAHPPMRPPMMPHLPQNK